MKIISRIMSQSDTDDTGTATNHSKWMRKGLKCVYIRAG